MHSLYVFEDSVFDDLRERRAQARRDALAAAAARAVRAQSTTPATWSVRLPRRLAAAIFRGLSGRAPQSLATH